MSISRREALRLVAGVILGYGVSKAEAQLKETLAGLKLPGLPTPQGLQLPTFPFSETPNKPVAVGTQFPEKIGTAAVNLAQETNPFPVTPTHPIVPTHLPELATLDTPVKVFDNAEANEAAREFGITVGDFFKFDSKVLERCKVLVTAQELLPIFPPAVHVQKKLIYELSEEFKVHPNIIAIVMAIESAGNPEAGSYAGAQGLMQVMPHHFPPELRYPEAMREPQRNMRAGVKYYLQSLSRAREVFSKLPENHIFILAWALIGYNAGVGRIGDSFEELPGETKFYGDHFIRFALTAEIAQKLRTKGLDNRQIVERLSSREIDARAFALDEFRTTRNRNFTYSEYDQVVRILKAQDLREKVNGNFDIPTTLREEIVKYYQEYLNKPEYTLPLSAGLRIWTSFGGYDLLSSINPNTDKSAYLSISTSR